MSEEIKQLLELINISKEREKKLCELSILFPDFMLAYLREGYKLEESDYKIFILTVYKGARDMFDDVSQYEPKFTKKSLAILTKISKSEEISEKELIEAKAEMDDIAFRANSLTYGV
ncbi:MAG: hypothetical protein LBL47_00280 [Lactobacillus sp.]|jgi:hypothetical protein|nr:hypothetical protein [Lactobacillus sp.]